MTTVVVSPTGVLGFPEGGGHWWVYLQYVLGLQDLGCDVWWLERVVAGEHRANVAVGLRRLETFGLSGKVLAYEEDAAGAPVGWVSGDEGSLDRLADRADLLLNFDYRSPARIVGRFDRSALIDIDPGLLQQWISFGQLSPAPHNRWFTIGETVGTARATFPDAGIVWERIRPVVHLRSWPVRPTVAAAPYTTVTSWWGDEWIADGAGLLYENNKRVAFLQFAEVPLRSGANLELAAYFGDSRADHFSRGGDVTPEDAAGDADDVRRMRDGGWRLRRSVDVAADPWAYQRYVQDSRGEFSCAKPSCLELQNAWISDRTLCYLASGRPAVVQHTGPSDFLPDAEGLFRFSSPGEAVEALHLVESDYERHRVAARGLAESLFDSVPTLTRVLDASLSGTRSEHGRRPAATGRDLDEPSGSTITPDGGTPGRISRPKERTAHTWQASR